MQPTSRGGRRSTLSELGLLPISSPFKVSCWYLHILLTCDMFFAEDKWQEDNTAQAEVYHISCKVTKRETYWFYCTIVHTDDPSPFPPLSCPLLSTVACD